MSTTTCRFLRPYLHKGIQPSAQASYARFFSACSKVCAADKGIERHVRPHKPAGATTDYEKRVAQLEKYKLLETCYPLLGSAGDQSTPQTSIKRTLASIEGLGDGTTAGAICSIHGRVRSVRTAGSKLVFVDVEEGGSVIQIVCNYGKLEHDISQDDFRAFKHVIRKGDWYTFDGYPHKSPTGESKLLSTRLPILVSPSLHQLPEQLDNAETLARRPHINMLVHPETVQVLKMRSRIDEHLDWFFRNAGHTKVSTPLLAAGAGGAVARPFETVATEMEGTRLNLRIAPELWLKRLLVGGIGRVYEIGPAFRNEGVDATHNPEFTVCEAYAPFSTLSDLMAMTEDLLRTLNKRLREIRAEADLLTESVVDLHEDAHSHGLFREDFKRLPFIPTIENAIGRKLPNLGDPTVHQSLVDLFSDLSLPLPANANLPRLLDALCALYIEPLCTTPTFIISHPACLSPLSKSHTCPITNQQVALRAELFIDGTEYANMYEEENSPFAQREKFLQQLKYRSIDGEGDGNTDIDESYLEALEWGLSPTGGWGLGVDRLVMLFTGMKRIGDVLPFGTLRNVVGLAQRQK